MTCIINCRRERKVKERKYTQTKTAWTRFLLTEGCDVKCIEILEKKRVAYNYCRRKRKRKEKKRKHTQAKASQNNMNKLSLDRGDVGFLHQLLHQSI